MIFETLYRRFKLPIFRYLKLKISDEAIAEELTQEVFLKAYRFRESYQDRYSVSTWLWTIAKNTVSDHLRKTRLPSDQQTDLDGESAAAESVACERPCPEGRILIKEQRRNFLRMIRSLTRPQKRVLWMRLIHQLSYEEISNQLRLSNSAVKNLVYRAKLRLETLEFSAL